MKKRIAVIGGGLVGLATADELLRRFPEASVTVLEKEDRIAAHQSGHNSGVIHSGIYYKPGSLKALNCIRGRSLLLDFCRTHNIAHEICGKLIVATSQEEIPALDRITERGITHGLRIRALEAEEARVIEPSVSAKKAIFVPEAGIVDYPHVARVLRTLIEEKGGTVQLGFKVTGFSYRSSLVRIHSMDRIQEFDRFVNCAGLYSDVIARLAGTKLSSKIIPFRGEYFQLRANKAGLCKNLIYPVPDPRFPFLGVHFTRMIHGGVECGPNAVFALAREGYSWGSFNIRELTESLCFSGFQSFAREHWRTGLAEVWRSLSKTQFVKSLSRLIPEISLDDLEPGGSGVRAQALDAHGKLIDDFLFESSERGLHVLNAPSPAATSCLSLAETIVERLLALE